MEIKTLLLFAATVLVVVFEVRAAYPESESEPSSESRSEPEWGPRSEPEWGPRGEPEWGPRHNSRRGRGGYYPEGEPEGEPEWEPEPENGHHSVSPDCLFGTFYRDVGKAPSCSPYHSSCPRDFFCEVSHHTHGNKKGHCCLSRNPCVKGYPWIEKGRAVSCMGKNSRVCPKGYACTGSYNYFSACCPVLKCDKKKDKHHDDCSANLCKLSHCTTIPEAQCVMDTCGGCKARWFMFKKKTAIEVTDQCKRAPPCPYKYPLVHCKSSPCKYSACKNTKWTSCYNYYCGGCYARYFNGLREVTHFC